MVIQSRDEALSFLHRFVGGDIGARELMLYLRGLGVQYFDDFLEQVNLGCEDFSHIAITESQLATRIKSFLEGRVPIGEFADWVCQLYVLHSSPEYQHSSGYSHTIESSLLLLTLLADDDLTESRERSKALIAILYNALRRKHAIPSSFLLGKLFSQKECLHLVTQDTGTFESEPWRGTQWADIALLHRPHSFPWGSPEGERELADEKARFVPLAVCTREFWEAMHPTGAWCHPENDKMHVLRERYGLADFRGKDAQYFVDSNGLVEIVLDCEQLGSSELGGAVRLFCLWNQVSRSYLNGHRTYPTLE